MTKISRRKALQGSALGVIGLSLPFSVDANSIFKSSSLSGKPYPEYPSMDPELVSEVVGKSHFDLDRVKELVENYPELASATWEWRFGDFESAIGAASHVGRRDIVEYLLSKGARPNIFTYAVLGAFDVVKGMIACTPGVQRNLGPHGFSLLHHANASLRMEKNMTSEQIENCKKLIAFLEELGDADGPIYLEISEEEKDKLLGDYLYGEDSSEGFSIKLNMRKQPSLGPIGGFGGALYKLEDNLFTYNGAPSVRVSFQWENESVKSLTVKMPGSEVTAEKI